MPHEVASPPERRAATLGAVIVNYRTAELTVGCIDSLLEHRIVDASAIVVVDNGSSDGSGEAIRAARPHVRVILSPRNGGYAAGVNLGVGALATELVLVLNPDTLFRENSFAAIDALFAQTPTLGMLGLKLVNPDGSLQYSARRYYSLMDIVLRRTPLGRFAPFCWITATHLLTRQWAGDAFPADWVMGTGFVVRRRAFDSVGRMDEGYFLYFEEVDLCARMWIGGWSVMAIPQSELVHEHQRHSKAGFLSPVGRIHLRSMRRFFDKYGIPWLRRPSLLRLEQGYVRWQNRSTATAPLVRSALAE